MEIVIKKLYFNYKDKSLFEDVNLKIDNSSVTGIIGDNNCGKTTLLELLGLILKQEKGIISYDNVNISNKTKKSIKKYMQSKISYLDNNVLVYGTLRNNLDVDPEIDLNDAMKALNIDESILDKKVENLSSGEQKKAMLLKTLVKPCDLILIDDIDSLLDDKTKQSLIKFVRNLKVRFSRTIIITSKDINFLHSICDDVILINDKVIIGNKYNIFENMKLNDQPDLIRFSNIVYKNKNKKIGYRDDIKDLIKDIYRYAK